MYSIFGELLKQKASKFSQKVRKCGRANHFHPGQPRTDREKRKDLNQTVFSSEIAQDNKNAMHTTGIIVHPHKHS